MKPYYQDDHCQIFNCDCRELLPSIGLVDLLLTDPPYEQEAHTRTRRVRDRDGGVRYAQIDFDVMTDDLREALSNVLCNWSVTFCQVEAVSIYRSILGSKYRRAMTWIKPDCTPQFSGDRPAQGYECMITAWHAAGRSRWNSGGKRGVYTHQIRDGQDRVHPTQKPLSLMRELISDFHLGGTILDPFMGSGSTLRDAKDLGLFAIGIELNEKYCEAAVKRLQQEPLFGATQ